MKTLGVWEDVGSQRMSGERSLPHQRDGNLSNSVLTCKCQAMSKNRTLLLVRNCDPRAGGTFGGQTQNIRVVAQAPEDQVPIGDDRAFQ